MDFDEEEGMSKFSRSGHSTALSISAVTNGEGGSN